MKIAQVKKGALKKMKFKNVPIGRTICCSDLSGIYIKCHSHHDDENNAFDLDSCLVVDFEPDETVYMFESYITVYSKASLTYDNIYE